MDWEKTSIRLKFINANKYTNGHIVRTFNNIVADPTPEQLKTFAQAIELLSDGDTFSSGEVLLKDKFVDDTKQ